MSDNRIVIKPGDEAKNCEKCSLLLVRGTDTGDRFFKLKEKLEKENGFTMSGRQVLTWLMNEAKIAL